MFNKKKLRSYAPIANATKSSISIYCETSGQWIARNFCIAELWNSTICWLKETKSLQRLDTATASLSRNCNLPRIITLHINQTITRAQRSSLGAEFFEYQCTPIANHINRMIAFRLFDKYRGKSYSNIIL